MIGVLGRVDSDPINLRGGRVLFKFPSGGADLFFFFAFPFFPSLKSFHLISSHLFSTFRLCRLSPFILSLLYFYHHAYPFFVILLLLIPSTAP